jgi:hypothetical protein
MWGDGIVFISSHASKFELNAILQQGFTFLGALSLLRDIPCEMLSTLEKQEAGWYGGGMNTDSAFTHTCPRSVM